MATRGTKTMAVSLLARTALEDFRKHLEEDGAEPKTVRTYVNAVSQMILLNPKEPWRLLETLHLTKRTKVTYLAALKRFAAWKKDDKLRDVLESRATKKLLTVRGGRPPKQTLALPDEEVEAIMGVLEAYKGQDPLWIWPVFRLMVKLALRANVDLTWITHEAVQEALRNGSTLTIVTKGGRERGLPVSGVVEELEALLALPRWDTVADLIAPGSNGDRRHDAAYEAVRRVLKRLAAEAGIDPAGVHTHRLRHAAAHWLLRETKGDIFLVRDLLGHNSVKTTETYLRTARTGEIADALSRRFEK